MKKKKTRSISKVTPLTLGERIKKVLTDYLKTQFLLMIIVTALVWGVLYLLKVKFALILAFGTGALSIIPSFGMIIATIIAALVAIFDQVTFLPHLPTFVEGLIISIVFVLLNKIVDLFLAPLLFNKTVKIHPAILVLSVFLGTVLFGVLGAVLAVPALLVFKTILEYLKENSSKSLG